MSIRSLFLGTLAAISMCLFCYLNDKGIRSGTLIQHLLPSVAYGGMALFVILVNPILRLCRRQAALRRGEVATILLLVLVTCGIPGWNLASQFSPTCMMPYHDYRTTPAWRTNHILDYAPQGALCDISGPEDEERALNGFISGLGRGEHAISVADVPWHAWLRPFAFWGPVIVSFLVAIFGLAAVFHRQWSAHEQLPYPIIQFATAMLPDDRGGMPSILRNRLFILGFSLTFILFLNNYACRYAPHYVIPVSLQFNLGPFSRLCPTILHGRGGPLFYPSIIFTVVGLAYFLPSEASFTMWIGPWIYCFIGGVFAAYGINLRGGKMMELTPELFIFTGGYFGLFLTILYTGRQFYWNALRRAIGLRAREEIPRYCIFGMRVFLVAIAVFIALLQAMGIHWTLGIPYAFLTIMVYACISRVLAETGAFEVGSFVYPCVFLWGVFGSAALGPKVLLTLFLVSTMLVSTPGWATMPFLNQGFKIADNARLPMLKSSRWGLLTMVIAIFVAIPATIYWQYTIGASHDWSRISAQYPFNTAIEVIHKLEAQGLADQAMARSGFDHLLNLSPDWSHLGFFAAGMAVALIIAAGRLKFPWWPFHPIICIFFGGDQAMKMSFSFGLGCLLKYVITKYGGGKMYQTCKPLFIGIITGMLTEELVQMIIGAAVYACTGTAR